MPRSTCRVAVPLLIACAAETAPTDSQSFVALDSVPGDSVPAPPAYVTVLAAGDIAKCGGNWGDDSTAALIDSIPGTVLALGDVTYDNATTTSFANCYTPTWGRFKDRTRPAIGNHEYNTKLPTPAAPFFDYFGAAAGPPGKGYYTYPLGAWKIIVLNSQTTSTTQLNWLKANLDATTDPKCVLAYWHHPYFTSGQHPGASRMKPYVEVLFNRRADLVLTGHNHNYERLARMNSNGVIDTVRGVRHFTVGTGGAGKPYPFSDSLIAKNGPRSEVRWNGGYGVLKVDLYPDKYSWKFIPAVGQTFSDSGTTYCH